MDEYECCDCLFSKVCYGCGWWGYYKFECLDFIFRNKWWVGCEWCGSREYIDKVGYNFFILYYVFFCVYVCVELFYFVEDLYLLFGFWLMWDN